MKTCKKCGKRFKPIKSSNPNVYCSRDCYYVSRVGVARVLYRISREYKYLFRPDHPDASKQGYIAEHRLVAEQMLGRRLMPDEVVHHKNHKRGDNRPENLEVCTRKEHARHHDWTKNLPDGKAVSKMARSRKRNSDGTFI